MGPSKMLARKILHLFQIKLVDVPELKYFSVEDRGEVCFRGAGVMTGYYNNDDATAEAIDEQVYKDLVFRFSFLGMVAHG